MILAALILASPAPLDVRSVDLSVTVLAPLTLTIAETPLGLIAEAHCDDPDYTRADWPELVPDGLPVLAVRGMDVRREPPKLLAGGP